MPSIIDVAKLAGVSHGTASNVLNGKGNVSVDKIRRVEEAARQLGYSINAQAKILRKKGTAQFIAIILPDVVNPSYAEFFTAVNSYIESEEYIPQLYLSDNIPAKEEAIVELITTQRVDGAVIVTCIPESTAIYQKLVDYGAKLVFVERRPTITASYVGFDYRAAGVFIRNYFHEKGLEQIGLISGLDGYSNESEFEQGFFKDNSSQINRDIPKLRVKLDKGIACKAAFSFLKDNAGFTAIATSNPLLAEGLLTAYLLGSTQESPLIVSLSPLGVIPSLGQIIRYELNYRRLGIEAGRILSSQLMEGVDEPINKILPGEGFKYHLSDPDSIAEKGQIKVLMLESPAASALIKLTPGFTKKTGIEVSYVTLGYDELYQAIGQIENSGLYDILRLSTVWLPWLKNDYLLPLTDLRQKNPEIFDKMVPEILDDFSCVNGIPYALPFDLSIQLLYYRKDLFEDPMTKRMYYEQYHTELTVPETFEEYNQIAAFFTRSINPDSPVEYGTTFTPTGMVSEYLPRLFGMGGRLFDQFGQPCLDSPEALKALQNYQEAMLYSYPVHQTAWWDISVRNFIEGKVAMMIMFVNHATDSINSGCSKVAGKVGYTAVPGKNPLLGGGSLGIFKNCKKVAKANKFLEWACSEEISVVLTLLGGVSPCLSVYDNYELLQMYPWLDIALKNLKYGNRREMLKVNGKFIEEYEFEHILGVAVKNTILDVIPAEEALAYAQKRIKALIEQYQANR